MRAATLTPSPKMACVSSSVMTSPRCTPMRNIRRRSSSSMPLKCAMRSWMSIAVASAAIAELNSASTELPTMFTTRPPAPSMAGRQMSAWTDFRCPTVRSSPPSIRRTKPLRSAWRMAERRRRGDMSVSSAEGRPRTAAASGCVPCPSCPSRTLCKRASDPAPASSTVRHSIIRRYRPSCDRGHTTGNIRRRQVPRATTCSSAPRSRTTIRPRP